MKRFIYVISFLLALLMTVTAYAHSGRTDSSGGHRNTSDGTYHYHFGDDTTVEYPLNPAGEIELNISIDKFYEEFPTVPNLGYYSNLEIVEVFEEDGIYVYFYDILKLDSRMSTEYGIRWGEAMAEAGFYNYEAIENGLLISSDEILVLYEYDEEYIYITIGYLNNEPNEPLEGISVKLNGETIEFDQPPENINGRIMVPIRYVVEKMGCTVEWDGETQTVYINQPYSATQKKAIKTDNINVYVNNELIIFTDQQPVNINGRILVPVRFVTEKLGHQVEWDGTKQIVYIDSLN